MGVLLTSPGIPLIFMGQEFLADKQWSDIPNPSFEIGGRVSTVGIKRCLISSVSLET